MEKINIVVFSDDWGRHPSSCQHIFGHLLSRCKVTWINTIGLRTVRVSLYDLKRAFQVLRNWASSSSTSTKDSAEQKKKTNPTVLAPMMLPSFRNRCAAYVNQKILLRTVRKALISDGKNILVSTLPIIPDIFSANIFDRAVYYCVDDFTTWPGVDGAAMRRLESEVLQYCDLLIATSSKLLRSRGVSVKKACLLTHGVDVEHFAQAVHLSPPDEIARLPKPVIGFFGVFDGRMDGDILNNISHEFAAGSIVILGPIDRDIRPFASLKNVHFMGPVSYRELPSWASGFDACILPYKVDESTESINPLKLREYLATGKPVISTPLPEAARLSQYLRIAIPDDLPEAVRQEMENNFSARPDVEAFLRGESWKKKAEDFWQIITEGL